MFAGSNEIGNYIYRNSDVGTNGPLQVHAALVLISFNFILQVYIISNGRSP